MKKISTLILACSTSLVFAQTISESRIKDIVTTLAADNMKGRKVGTPENEKAAEYIAEQFKKNKLDYCYGKSYLVPFHYNDEMYFNVCAIKKGKTDKIIAFGAHFDHIGERTTGEDKIYNGADDNASGTSAVIALSDYYKDRKDDYSYMFLGFNAEEIGLVGSDNLSNNAEFKKYLPNIKALFNFEMIGTKSEFGANKMFMTGDNVSDLKDILNQNAVGDFKIVGDPYLDQGLFYRSDNVGFVKKDVIAHSFSTVDMNHQNHYHKVNDDISVIDFKNLTDLVNSFAKTLDKTLQKDFNPKYNEKLEK
ncbi:M28 family peptidase [Soonwooa sp.]|uniref:M28 family peptidase n=1 Tax=Soonwooa sp. TaxID=1938592 RepID=UPI0028987FA6|nr:M28 family peptidase [Soonwooa sp.]